MLQLLTPHWGQRCSLAIGVIAGALCVYQLRGANTANAHVRPAPRDLPGALTHSNGIRAATRAPAGAPAGNDSWLLARISALEGQLRELTAVRDDVRHAEDASNAAKRASLGLAVTECELGDKMSAAIQRERDTSWTQAASRSIEGALTGLPHVEVEEVECGSRFCRAAFISDDGLTPDHDAVMRAVPLENEAFTVAREEGRVEVYFTRAGQRSIESMLREPAL